ncbi:hypothetical protein Syun_009572 [Stephania yunnanensis]|uniref:Uncharacterized protein n=1 Tax=Stephania yunnanensis TaxID=152371 RepID=A0AAP0KGE1_9MAGN
MLSLSRFLSRGRGRALTLAVTVMLSPPPQLVRLLRRPLSRSRMHVMCFVLRVLAELPSPILGEQCLPLRTFNRVRVDISIGLILLLEAIRLVEREGARWHGPFLDGYKLVQQRMVNVLRLRMGKARLSHLTHFVLEEENDEIEVITTEVSVIPSGAKRKLAEISVDSNSVNSLAASDLVSKKSLDHGDGNNAVVMIDDEELEGSKKKRLR